MNQELSRLLVPLESYVCTIYLPVPRTLSSVSTRPPGPSVEAGERYIHLIIRCSIWLVINNKIL